MTDSPVLSLRMPAREVSTLGAMACARSGIVRILPAAAARPKASVMGDVIGEALVLLGDNGEDCIGCLARIPQN